MALPNEPLARTEQYLNRTATGGGTIPDEPLTRVEQYLAKIAGEDVTVPDVPYTRIEQYLDYIAENGGGGGVDPESITLLTLNVSLNGTTNAPSGTAYNKVIVDVPVGIEPVASEWQNVTDPVKNYLTQVTYNPSDYSTSQIDNYAPSTPVQANAKPVGKTLSLSAGTLNRNGFKRTVSAGNNTLYNDVPLAKTPYTVQNASGAIADVGTLRPSFFLRWVDVGGVENVRDLGGWSCDGGTVKYGKIFRGGEMEIITDAGKNVLLNQLLIRADIDLRKASETGGATTSDLGALVDYVWYAGNWYYADPTEGVQANENAVYLLTAIMQKAIDGKPMFIHCKEGADRTGTICFILENVLGMSQSDIDKEYELTCFDTGLGGTVVRRRTGYYLSLIQYFGALTGDTMQEKVVGWLVSIGVPIATINSFRHAVIDGNPADFDPITPPEPIETNKILTSTATIGGTELYNGTGYLNETRWRSDNLQTAAMAGSFTTGYIAVSPGDVVRFYGDIVSGNTSTAHSGLFDASGAVIVDFTSGSFYAQDAVTENFAPFEYDRTTHSLKSITIPANGAYLKLSLVGSFAAGTTVITINEEES